MMNPKIVSIFSGVGGIDTGFKNAGFSTIFANDNWKNACESWRSRTYVTSTKYGASSK